jgi:hypothetical protein
MVKILLLDCSESLENKLASQGFHVESGSVGYCTGVRKLPSQVYEKDLFIYNPESCSEEEPLGVLGQIGQIDNVKDLSPEYDLQYLEARIKNGAVFLPFVNRLYGIVEKQNKLYRWIPFMPPIEFTSDKIAYENSFERYPDSKLDFLSPVVTAANLSYPVMHKLKPPPKAVEDSKGLDSCYLFWNGHGDCLGVIILRGSGALIVLPRFHSNEDVIDTFLHRVIPKLYGTETRTKLTDSFKSAAEGAAQKELDRLVELEERVRQEQASARIALETATRQKLKTLEEDVTAKQIQVYYDHALKQGDAAVYYLYKIIDVIENKFGGETAGIDAVGERTAWKAVKRLANESYRDARHAPKPGDVIKKWSTDELDQCIEDTKKVALAYFSTLFKS